MGLVLGAVMLLLAIPQAISHLASSAQTGLESSMKLPTLLVAQIIGALVISTYCATHALGSFKPIRGADDYATKSMASSLHHDDFAIYNHRSEPLAALMEGVRGSIWNAHTR